ncbi:hypothetical protein [Streptomyces sp. NPDC057686]|uniref:hypothetical protein n=1 Tax=Streptomyces sp. NPDC057686 TaxID=3346212 RepID=UPI003687B767
MGTLITASSLARSFGGSSIEHASSAGLACLEKAGMSAADIDVLVNVGIYRDSNIVEPSIAALIQKRIGINRDYLNSPDRRAAFSFDLMNGACGMLNAVQAAGALLETGSARRVLIVSGDTHPSTDLSKAATSSFPYASTGAALLLEHGESAVGFGRIHHRTRQGSHGVNGYLPLRAAGSAGRSTIVVDRDHDVLDRMLDLAVDSVHGLVAAEDGVTRDAVAAALRRTLLITSQPSPDFTARLAGRLGLPEGAAVTVRGVEGDPHTSALVHGYQQARHYGRLAGRDRILFLTVGAGLSSAAALYRIAPAELEPAA